MKTLLPILTLLLSGAAIAPAADKPNLSGTWKADMAKSDFSPVLAPEGITRTVVHSEPAISFEDLQESAIGKELTTRKYSTDGKEISFESQGAEVKSAAKWDGKILQVTSRVEAASIKVAESITLSEDGKTMNSVVKYQTPQGDLDLKILYVKQ